MIRTRDEAHRAARAITLLACSVMLLTACMPGAGGPSPQAGSAPASGPKTLIMGTTISDGEPTAGGFAYGASSTGRAEAFYLLHAGLTVYDDQANTLPRLVERVPTIDNGDWKVLPDGRMEVTWQLRRDAVWHDGAPLVADDVVLGFKAGIDPELFERGTRVLRHIGEVTAPDRHTVVMNWRNSYVFANELTADTMIPLPQHLIGALYESGNKEAFAASPLLTDEFVGLGPYRLKEWSRGSFIEVHAFDQYVLGRTKIDRIIIRLIGDTNALVVRTVSGEIHVIPVGIMGEGEAHTLTTQLEPSGLGRVIRPQVALVMGEWQYRDSTLPWAQDARVRLALVKLLDRQSMVDSVLNGLGSVDDLLFAPTDPGYQLAKQKGLPNTSYDPAEGHRLLAAAGWTRDATGQYRSRTGEPFAVTILAAGDNYTRVQLTLSLASLWKSSGLDTKEQLQPGTMDGTLRDEQRAMNPGVYYSRQRYAPGLSASFDTVEVASQGNRWRGTNKGGYSSAPYDQLRERFQTTFARSERDQIAADMNKHLLDNSAYLPTVTSSEAITVLKNVRGVTSLSGEILRTAWNAHTWEID